MRDSLGSGPCSRRGDRSSPKSRPSSSSSPSSSLSSSNLRQAPTRRKNMPPNMGSSLLTGTKKAEARGTRGRSRSVTQPAPTIDNTNTKPTRESLPPPPRVPAVEGSAATTRPRLKSAKNNNGNTNNSRTGRPSTLDTVQRVVDVSQSVSPVSPPTEKRSHSTTEKVFRREQNGRVSRHANSKDHASGQANPSPTPRE
ncbi:unnamed protein product, partial [Sphacelaria rigidula]